MSLSTWLRDYLYISLGGNRKGKVRTYVNLFLTMLLGGLWHGASFRFILWGALHGVALAVHKFFTGLHLKPLLPQNAFTAQAGKILGLLITFHFVCFCWIFFRASNMEIAGQMITQIITHFSPQILWDFISGYKVVFFLMVLGYVLHFIPRATEQRAERWVTDQPLALKAALMLAIIVLVIQTKAAGIQPFIYFQF